MRRPRLSDGRPTPTSATRARRAVLRRRSINASSSALEPRSDADRAAVPSRMTGRPRSRACRPSSSLGSCRLRRAARDDLPAIRGSSRRRGPRAGELVGTQPCCRPRSERERLPGAAAAHGVLDQTQSGRAPARSSERRRGRTRRDAASARQPRPHPARARRAARRSRARLAGERAAPLARGRACRSSARRAASRRGRRRAERGRLATELDAASTIEAPSSPEGTTCEWTVDEAVLRASGTAARGATSCGGRTRARARPCAARAGRVTRAGGRARG